MSRTPRSLVGKVVAITGAARGIGRSTAEALLREGARIAIGDLDFETAKKTAQELGPQATAFEVNVTEVESFRNFLDAVEEQVGPIDVLVNNAGIMQLGRFIDESIETADRQVDINLRGLIYGCKLVIPKMLTRGSGHIINIASQAGKNGFAGGATYSATKHAVVGLSEAIRSELRGSGIDVSVVMPGLVNTELSSGVAQAGAVKHASPSDVADAIVKALKTGKFDMHVPPWLEPINGFASALPRPARDFAHKLFKVDSVLMKTDQAQRAAYEERASKSEPK